MLSADVPEFVPRAYQNRGSSSNTVVSKPKETTPQPQQITSTSRAYKPTQNSRFGLTRAHGSSWPEENEKELGPSVSYPKQNDVWRQSGREPGSWREISKHESRTETHSSPLKNSEMLILQKGRGRGKPMTREDLESQIKNKFVTASKSPSHSYKRILQNNPQNSKSDIKPSKQDFSLDIDNQWPTLGGLQPQTMSDQSSESVKTKGTTNPWVCRSSEIPPIQSPAKSSLKLWQERGAAEPSKTTAVRPKNTKGHHQASENAVIAEQGTRKLQANAEIQAFLSDSRKLEGKRRHAHKSLHNVETEIQASSSDSAFNTEDKNSSGISKHEETDKVTRNSTADEDSDPFQWKVIGEKKKKGKIKEEEAHGSPRLQELRGDGKKYTRNLPDKLFSNVERKQAQEYPGKAKKHGIVSMFDKSVRSSSHETHGEKKKDQPTPKSNLKEGRKSRPTKVASLANCSSDKREIRSTAKKSTAVVATKPVDEETLQRKLAAKYLKQEEKKKKREMKAKQALALHRPKDTRVSFITTDFLEKAQTCNQKTFANQMSEQEMLHPSSTGHGMMAFTAEDYPALDMQRHTTPGLPLNRTTEPRTSCLQTKKSRETLPTRIKIQNNDSAPRYNKAVTRTSEKAAVASEKHPTTYKTALLAAKEKETNSVQALRSTEDNASPPIETVLKKKNVKTTDRIELDIFALAAHSGKKKKKKELLAEQEYSPTKSKLQQEQKGLTSKAGFTTHSLPNKGAAVVAKRGIISTKPKKKKVSRVKKCQMEKRQRDMLAVQLLLEQAKLRIAQQESLTTPAAVHTEADEPCGEIDSVGSISTNEELSSSFMVGKDQENGDGKRRRSDVIEAETQDEDNKENTRSSDVPLSAVNTSTQVSDKAPYDNNDKKPKVIWILNEAENPVPQSATPKTVKADNSEEGKPSNHTEEGSPTSPVSPACTDPLMNDPLVVQRASELISYFTSQSNRPQGTREYVHQVVTPEVNAVAKELMTSLIAFQARHYQRDPVKARIKRRYVFGLKETTKLMKRMSCVIMAPNIEQCDGPGSLDDAVEKLLNQAEKHKVPVVFALSLRAMRKLCSKKVKKVSCFGIISYQGAQDLFKHLMELLPEAQKQYQQLVACGQCSLPEEEEEEEKGGGVDGKKGKQEAEKDLTKEVIAHTNALLMAP